MQQKINPYKTGLLLWHLGDQNSPCSYAGEKHGAPSGAFMFTYMIFIENNYKYEMKNLPFR